MARILIADNDELLREFLMIRLAVCGHSVVEAEDGAVALDCMIADNFDLVLLADVMPSLTGWEALEAIHRLGQHETKVVMMSQMTPLALLVKAKGSGVAACLQKPFCFDELSALIAMLIAPKANDGATGKRIRSALTSAALVAASMSTVTHAQTLTQNAPAAPPSNCCAEIALDSKATGEEFSGAKWTIGVSHQKSTISNGDEPAWYETQTSVEYSPKKTKLYTAEVTRSSRFGLTDHSVTLRGDWRIASNASAYLGIAASPEGNFKEKWGVRAGGGVGLGQGIEISVDSRLSNYASGTKFSLNPQLGVSLADERIALSAGWINLWESGNKHYQGWSARLRVNPDDRIRLYAGVAHYPEVETGITRKVQSAFSALSYKASKKLEVSLSYARSKYEGAFSQQALTLGLRWKLSKDP